MTEKLQKAFASERDEEADYKRLRHLIDTAKKYSPTAAGIIEAAGTGYCFENIDSIGSYSSGSDLVRLNPKCPDEVLLSTLVHECRHALQSERGNSFKHDIRTNLQWNRAMEADAMALQCSAAYEMKEALPGVWDSFCQKHAQVALSYAGTLKNTKDQDKALSAAFKAWHEDDAYVSLYDSKLLEAMLKHTAKSEDKSLNTLFVDPEEIGEEICRRNGKSYLEKGFMPSQQALTVREWDVWPKVVQLKYAISEKTGTADASAEEMFTKNIFGTVRPRRTLFSALMRPSAEKDGPAENIFLKVSAAKTQAQAGADKSVQSGASAQTQPGSARADTAPSRDDLKNRIAAMKGRLPR